MGVSVFVTKVNNFFCDFEQPGLMDICIESVLGVEEIENCDDYNWITENNGKCRFLEHYLITDEFFELARVENLIKTLQHVKDFHVENEALFVLVGDMISPPNSNAFSTCMKTIVT